MTRVRILALILATWIAMAVAGSRSTLTATNEVQFSMTGAGRVLGVRKGDPASHEPARAGQRRALSGLCLAILQTGHTPGVIALGAESGDLNPASASLEVRSIENVDGRSYFLEPP